MKTKLMLAGLMLFAVASFANGQSQAQAGKNTARPAAGIAYVDENKNGVCDNYENRVACRGNGRAAMNYRKGQGAGNGQCYGRGPCNGQGRGRGRGQCRVMR